VEVRGVLLFGLLAACETADSSPTPTPIVPVPVPVPVPVDAAPVAVDAAPPPLVANLHCFYNGPKELIRLEAEGDAMKGRLYRMSAGPIPNREIFYTVKPESSTTFALVFDRYDKNDYTRMWNAKPSTPREKMVAGKSVIARVYLKDSKSFIVGVDVDLATGMMRKFPDNAYPCQPYW